MSIIEKLLDAWPHGGVKIYARKNWTMIDLVDAAGYSVFEADHESLEGAARECFTWLSQLRRV